MLPLPLRYAVPDLFVARLQSEAVLQELQAAMHIPSPCLQGSQAQQGLQVLGICLEG